MMNIIFDKKGKYKNDNVVLIITAEDVKEEKVFPVVEDNAQSFIKAKLAHLKGTAKAEADPEPEEPKTLEEMTVKELEEFAATQEPPIDLGEAKTKPEKLEVIKAELAERETE